MNDLSLAISNSGMTKQKFADIVKMPYYRVATVLYGQDNLSITEVNRIKSIFGNNIFLPSTKRYV